MNTGRKRWFARSGERAFIGFIMPSAIENKMTEQTIFKSVCFAIYFSSRPRATTLEVRLYSRFSFVSAEICDGPTMEISRLLIVIMTYLPRHPHMECVLARVSVTGHLIAY